MDHTDVAIIGGGIVGLATAFEAIRRFPTLRIVILEKEPQVAMHQTGHNSGVLHTGIYYRPGSHKAANCRAGKQAMERFCREQGIPLEICGKVIVATCQAELPALNMIYERGLANGVRCELIGPERLAELEPHAAGVQAIHVPEAGIVDFKQVCERLAQSIEAAGSRIVCNARVLKMRTTASTTILETTSGEFEARQVVNCAGLYSDHVARLSGEEPSAKIIPFRGEYYELKPSATSLCRNLIYPVPDPSFPFLGVHFTRMITGGVECGPNAVLALAREGYHKSDVRLSELFETFSFPGFWKLARRHWRTGMGEVWRSLSKKAFVRALQRLVPEIKADDLTPAPAGVRAQAVSCDGQMVDDFLIVESERVINVCNAPSPAATSSLEIGRTIVDRLAARLDG
jgi:L-2-hydroxyglutarate oxidase